MTAVQSTTTRTIILRGALSFAATLVIFAELADFAPMRTSTNPTPWWTVCYMVLGAGAGAILNTTTRKYARFQLMFVGAASFGTAYHAVLWMHDLFNWGRLPFYPMTVLIWTILGGLGSSVLGWAVGRQQGAIDFLLAGALSFGIGQVIDLLIRNNKFVTQMSPLTTAEVIGIRITALLALGIIAGIGFSVACIRAKSYSIIT